MTHWTSGKLAGFGLLIVIMLTLTGCNSSHKTTNGKLDIVSSLDFYGEVAQTVAGDKGQVTSIINKPSMEPHEYEPTTNTAKTVSDADVVIYNGLGYDSWMPRLAVDNADTTRVNVASDIAHAKDGDNEHLWYDTDVMIHLADYLASAFSKRQPQNAGVFRANARTYKRQLQPIVKLVNQLKKNSHGELVNASEPVFDYALKAMGYRINNNHFAQAVQNDTDPSPKDIRQMDSDIKHHKIAFFVLNKQETNAVTNDLLKLCRQQDVPVLKVTESKPAGQNYVQWMMSQYQALAKIQTQIKANA